MSVYFSGFWQAFSSALRLTAEETLLLQPALLHDLWPHSRHGENSCASALWHMLWISYYYNTYVCKLSIRVDNLLHSTQNTVYHNAVHFGLHCDKLTTKSKFYTLKMFLNMQYSKEKGCMFQMSSIRYYIIKIIAHVTHCHEDWPVDIHIPRWFVFRCGRGIM